MTEMKTGGSKTHRWRRRSIVSIAEAEISQSIGTGPTALRRPELREVVGDQLSVEQRQLAERSGRALGEDLIRREAPVRRVAAAPAVVRESGRALPTCSLGSSWTAWARLISRAASLWFGSSGAVAALLWPSGSADPRVGLRDRHPSAPVLATYSVPRANRLRSLMSHGVWI